MCGPRLNLLFLEVVKPAHRLVLLGPPASGKGTQGQLLAAHGGMPITSIGELLRREHNLGTSLGLEADRFTSLGQLVPDETVVRSVESWLDAEEATGGFILDGTPRTLGQAAALNELLARRKMPLTGALLLEISRETITDRVRHRLVCERCGRACRLGEHVPSAQAACPACGGTLERRKDDSPETLAIRLAEYAEKTAPLMPFYEVRGLLRRVPGEGSIEEVFSRALTALGEDATEGVPRP